MMKTAYTNDYIPIECGNLIEYLPDAAKTSTFAVCLVCSQKEVEFDTVVLKRYVIVQQQEREGMARQHWLSGQLL